MMNYQWISVNKRSLLYLVIALALAGQGCIDQELKNHRLDDARMDADIERFMQDLFPDERPEPPEMNAKEPVVAPWTNVIDDALVNEALEINEERIVFPADFADDLASIDLMDVIVSANAENPFLRRVHWIEHVDETIILWTDQAEINDFMLAGQFSLDESEIEDLDLPVNSMADSQEDDLLPNGLRQYTQPLDNAKVSGSIGSQSSQKSKSATENRTISLTGEFNTRKPKADFLMKMDLDISFGGGHYCSDLKAAEDGTIIHRVAHWLIPMLNSEHTLEFGHKYAAVSTLAWTLKYAGPTSLCLGKKDIWDQSDACKSPMDYSGTGGHDHYDWSRLSTKGKMHRGDIYRMSWQHDQAVQQFRTYARSPNNNFAHNSSIGNTSPLGPYPGMHGVKVFWNQAKTNRQQVLKSYRKLAMEKPPSAFGFSAPAWNGIYPYDPKDPLGGFDPNSRSNYYDLTKHQKTFIQLLMLLEKTPEGDSLHWVQMAPVMGRKYCNGQVSKIKFGAGVDFSIEHKASVEVEVQGGPQTSQSGIQPINSPAISNVMQRYPMGRSMLFWIGFVPVYLRAEVGWYTKYSAGLYGYAGYTFGYPWKEAKLAFYHGIDYDGGRAGNKLIYEDLEAVSNGSRSSGFHLFSPATGTKAGTDPVYSHLTAGTRAELKFRSGPAIRATVYGTAGVGARLVAGIDGKLGVGVNLNDKTRYCEADAEAYIALQAFGSLKVPLCPEDVCGMAEISTDLYNSCKDGPNALCYKWDGLKASGCTPNQSGGTRQGNSYQSAGFFSGFQQSEVEPSGVNDVEGMYELDAIFIERDGKKIVPVRVEGIANCTAARGTVERGCPELLWYADFTTCDPDNWQEKVALIPDLQQFKVQFSEDIKVGDTLHIIRQGVPGNQVNTDGQRCSASGAMDFYVGAIDSDGIMVAGDEPVGRGIYNTNSFIITKEHLTGTYVDPGDDYWPESHDDNSFGLDVGIESPE